MTTQMALDLRAERARLSNQCEVILGRLQSGRVSNGQLSLIALKYTNRISELRKQGHVIKVVARDYASGIVWYALFVDGLEVAA